MLPDSSGPRIEAFYARGYEAFAAANPDHSFLIPPESEATLRADLAERSRAASSDPSARSNTDLPWDADFEIVEKRAHEQTIRVHLNWDDDVVNIGWYRADERTFWPLEHRYARGPMLVFIGGLLGLIVGALSVSVVRRTWLRPTA